MGGIEFSYPVMILALPLFYTLLVLNQRRAPAPTLGEVSLFQSVPKSPRQQVRPVIVHLLVFMVVSAVSIGAARPYRVLNEHVTVRRNVMLVLDVSPSMQAADIKGDLGRVTRMEAVKTVVQRFVMRRAQDRIGVVIFGGRGFLQSPLTSDHQFVLELVSTLTPGIAGDGTAIGEGLGVGLKRIRELPAESRAIILVTDGANNAGRVDPQTAADVASQLGIKVHTIGIGGNSADTQTSGGIFQLLVSQAEFDEGLLKEISQKTGGIYFNAGSVNQLQNIYDEIDRLLTTEGKDDPQQLIEELYWKAALVALFCLIVLVFLLATVFRRRGGPLI